MLKFNSIVLGFSALVFLSSPVSAQSAPADSQTNQPSEDTAITDAATAPERSAVLERLSGNDRYGTAMAVTTKRFADQSVDKVFIASGENFPDAISVNSMLGQVDEKQTTSAVLLSPSSGLTPEVLAEVKRLIKPGGSVVLVGGTQALAPVIVDQLTKLAPDVKVSRIFGPTRIETAIEIGNTVHDTASVEEVIITPSDDYRISIVASALTLKHKAVQLNAPHTADGTIHPAVQTWIDKVKPKKVTVVGRKAFLSAYRHPKLAHITDEKTLNYPPQPCPPGSSCPPVVEVAPAGPDQVIAEHILVDEFADSPHIVLVSRTSAVDGIAAGQFAAQQHAPILPIDANPPHTMRYAHILRGAGKRQQVTFWAIGGTKVISKQMHQQLAETFAKE